MVTDGDRAYHDEHFTMYTDGESLPCRSETNKILYVNYTSIKTKKAHKQMNKTMVYP